MLRPALQILTHRDRTLIQTRMMVGGQETDAAAPAVSLRDQDDHDEAEELGPGPMEFGREHPSAERAEGLV